jgi:hypothetical protein
VPYQTLVTGTTITAAWANANVRDQVVTPFASSAARTSAVTTPVEGMVSWLSDVDSLEVFNGTSWLTAVIGNVAGTNYTPTFATVTLGTGGTRFGRYLAFGKLVVGVGGFSLGTGGSVSNTLTMSLPFTAGAVGADWIFAGRGFDASTSFGASGLGVILDGETIGKNLFSLGTLPWGASGGSIPFTWASGDTFRSIFVYERA